MTRVSFLSFVCRCDLWCLINRQYNLNSLNYESRRCEAVSECKVIFVQYLSTLDKLFAKMGLSLHLHRAKHPNALKCILFEATQLSRKTRYIAVLP